MPPSASKILVRLVRFLALVALFAVLNYLGSALYQRAGGLTTVKPYGGVALALCLILGRAWFLPILAAGTLGGIMAKVAFSDVLAECVLTPSLASITLLAIYVLSERLIGRAIDFRAWRHLVKFIAIAAIVAALTAVPFSLQQGWWGGLNFITNWQAWFIPTTLSYVIFTPIGVLLATTGRDVFRAKRKAIVAAMAIMATVLAFNFIPLGLPILFTMPLALLVVTMMCGIEGTALGLMMIQLVLTIGTISGYALSPIASLSLGYQLYFTQVFISGLIVIMLPAAAAIDERIKLRDEAAAALRREEQVNQVLRESEQRYREMGEQAQTANKAKSEFLASMSHELRTPLNAILGFSEILMTQIYGPMGHAKYVEYAEDVHKSGAHLLELINDVLDLSKIDAGKMELRESVILVSELVHDAALLVQDKARGHVSLEVSVPAGLEVMADKRLLKQILINLLSNAIKFTAKGGAITVGVEQELAGGLQIYVADTGVGMDAAQMAKAFSPYGQIESKIAHMHQGTGLGLPIAQSLARLHGGDLVAQSTPGGGTRMMLLLPESRVIKPVRAALPAA